MKDTKLNKFLYGNKFFEYLKKREEVAYAGDFERFGVTITNQENYQKTIERSAMATFWIFATVVLVIVYSIVSPLT